MDSLSERWLSSKEWSRGVGEKRSSLAGMRDPKLDVEPATRELEEAAKWDSL